MGTDENWALVQKAAHVVMCAWQPKNDGVAPVHRVDYRKDQAGCRYMTLYVDPLYLDMLEETAEWVKGRCWDYFIGQCRVDLDRNLRGYEEVLRRYDTVLAQEDLESDRRLVLESLYEDAKKRRDEFVVKVGNFNEQARRDVHIKVVVEDAESIGTVTLGKGREQ